MGGSEDGVKGSFSLKPNLPSKAINRASMESYNIGSIVCQVVSFAWLERALNAVYGEVIGIKKKSAKSGLNSLKYALKKIERA